MYAAGQKEYGSQKMAKYSELDQKRALSLFLDGETISEISRMMGVSRQTLDTWSKAGHPTFMSGGRDWKTFREENRADVQTRAIVKQAVSIQKSSLDFLESTKKDVQTLFHSLKAELLAEGAEKRSYADIEKLLNIFIRLDNQGAEKIIWQQDQLRKMFTVILNRVKDERIVLQIRNDMIGIAAAEQKKLGDVPGKEFLPTPVEMVVEDEELSATLSISAELVPDKPSPNPRIP